MSRPPDATEPDFPRGIEPTEHSMTTAQSQVLKRPALPLFVAAICLFAGILRLQIADQVRASRSADTILVTRLENGVARVALPVPAGLDPRWLFEVEAPREASLYTANGHQPRLAPASCSERSCRYELTGASAGEAPLLAELTRSGRFSFEVMQSTSYGDVSEHVALRVRP